MNTKYVNTVCSILLLVFVYVSPSLSQDDGIISINGSASGTINSDKENYKFGITTPEDGILVIRTNSEDAKAEFNLKNEENHVISGRNAIKEGTLQQRDYVIAQGTYTITIFRYGGSVVSFNISNSFTPTSLPGDDMEPSSFENALVLPLNGSDTGHLGYYRQDEQYDNTDWWKVTVESNGVLIISVETDETLKTKLYLHFETDSYDDRITFSIDDGPVSNLQYNLGAGTYHIKVSRPEGHPGQTMYGSYTITSKLIPPLHPNDPEPNQTAEQASVLSPNSNDTGQLGYWIQDGERRYDSNDWWEITTQSDGFLDITTITDDDTLEIDLFLYDADENCLKSEYVGEISTCINHNIGEGTYYVKVHRKNYSRGYGSYTITNTLTMPKYENDFEPNNSEKQANEFVYNKGDTGHLGYYMLSKKGYDTTDWWKCVKNNDDSLEVITIADDNTLDINLYLYDSGMNWLKSAYGNSDTTKIQYGNAENDLYFIEVKRKDYTHGFGSYLISGEAGSETLVETIPETFHVFNIYPNPFNSQTTIEYYLPGSANVVLTIYNTTGGRVKILKNGFQPAGNHSVFWDASYMPSGIYFCTLKAGRFAATRKMVLVK